MNNQKYKFSIIIPIYNVEEYLAEAIESVIKQTIGFKENIQMILVNDGSPDNSEAICLKYQKEYPENIIYVKKENGGVSSARNKGLEYAEGKYINFLDSDDKWEINALKNAYDFFEKHYEEIDILGCIIEFFEGRKGLDHPLNYKFDKNKVVDIFNYYDHIQLSSASCFIKREALGKLRFNEEIKYSEDALFLTELTLQKEKIGFINNANYLYRKRLSENSAIQTKNKTDDWYTITPELSYKHLINLSKKKYGFVIPYIQYFITYEYQWRIRELNENLDPKIIDKYLKLSKELFENIEDYIILEQRNIPIEYKIELLNFKYNKNITKELDYTKHCLYFNNLETINFLSNNILKLTIMNFKKETIELKGLINLYLPKEDYKINLVINNNKRYELNIRETKLKVKKFFNKEFFSLKGFNINIPNKNINNMYFELIYKDIYLTNLNFSTDLNSKIDNEIKNYYIYDNKIYYYYNKRIKTKENTLKNRLKFSLRFLKQLILKHKFKIIIFRLLYKILKLFKRKEIWLISDRVEVANDNGMHLFNYIVNKKNQNIKPYFVISKNSKDYPKMKKIGKVLNYNSIKYKLYFLLSDKIISSQADSWVTNAFGKSYKYYYDLYNFNFIFLQHGIIIHDLSVWLNEYEKNFSIFVTSAEREYESIIKGDYGYNEKIVKLTGLSRYDNLTNENQKIIAIMPTWRKNIAGYVDKTTGIRKYSSDFKNTAYFKFYNDLINDERILNIMQKKGYKGIFIIHPSHMTNYIDFNGNNIFKIVKGYADYNKIFKEASLLVTDYSSVAFDFAYLNKPILYTQFDKDTFYKNHLYTKGYFKFEKDGLGPVIYDYEKAVEEIIKYIENDCKIEKKYQERINKFYKYHDQNNCKRVYEEILKLKD